MESREIQKEADFGRILGLVCLPFDIKGGVFLILFKFNSEKLKKEWKI